MKCHPPTVAFISNGSSIHFEGSTRRKPIAMMMEHGNTFVEPKQHRKLNLHLACSALFSSAANTASSSRRSDHDRSLLRLRKPQTRVRVMPTAVLSSPSRSFSRKRRRQCCSSSSTGSNVSISDSYSPSSSTITMPVRSFQDKASTDTADALPSLAGINDAFLSS